MTKDVDSAQPKTSKLRPVSDLAAGDFSHLDLSTQGLMETIPVPCFLIDRDGMFIAGNRAFYDITAGEREFFAGRDPYVLLMPGQVDHLRAIDCRLYKTGGNIAHEAKITPCSGAIREVVLKKSVLVDDDGASIGILSAIMDLSELAAVKNALYASESEKQAILDGFPGILCLFDVEEKLIWANDKLLDMHSNPVGKTCHQIFCGKEKSCNTCAVPLSLSRGTMQSTIQQFEMLTSSGEERVYELTGTPVKDNAGTVLSVVVIGRDVTEKNKLEKQLRHTQKMEAIGTLAGGIAHDFNNVLTPIMGYSEIIRMNILSGATKDEKTLLEYLDGILKAAKRAKSLVEQILTFSRSAEQKESPQNIQPIVKEVMKLMRVTLPRTITIREDIDEKCGRVSVDPTKIHQILINLCTNSSHAMDGEHGTLTVKLAASEPDSSGKDWLCLSVADTGSGIPQEVQHRIFEPYFTTKEKSRGTGMGLAMVHGIVSRMGGHIDINSTPGKGTIFSVYLPVSNQPIRIDQVINTTDFQRGSASVLVVDDEAQVVRVTSELLASLGYKVTSRTSPLSALSLVSDNPEGFDLVLTDQIMPELTGVELSRKIKRIRADLPIVLFTGYSDKLSAVDAQKAGIIRYCMKPVSLKDLSIILHETLLANS